MLRSPSYFEIRDYGISIRVSVASVGVSGKWSADTLKPDASDIFPLQL